MVQRRQTTGQAIVEFALMATLIFFLLAAAVDLGLIFFTVQALHNAAQEGTNYGSRWVQTNQTTGVTTLDQQAIRDRVRHEAGSQGIGFANLLDLNSNGVPDISPDGVPNSTCSGCEIDPKTGKRVIEDYIQVQALLDADNDGNPTNDGTAPDFTPCPDLANPTANCFIRVVVSSEYRMFFPLASAFSKEFRLSSQYVLPMRSGFNQAGRPSFPTVVLTVTPSPPPTPTATQVPTITPTPTITPVPTATNTPNPNCIVPNFIGQKWNNAQTLWSSAPPGPGFNTTVQKSGGSGNFTIRSQSIPAGSSRPCAGTIITVGP